MPGSVWWQQSGTKPLKLAPRSQLLPIATSARHASLLRFFSIGEGLDKIAIGEDEERYFQIV